MERVVQATGASIQSTCSDIEARHLGTCERFEERQVGNERFNFFEGCPAAKTCTLILRGGAEQFIAEVERSLHDAIMIVKRAIKNRNVVAGGGACEMELSAYSALLRGQERPPQTASNNQIFRQGSRNHPKTIMRQCRIRRDRHPEQITSGSSKRATYGQAWTL